MLDINLELGSIVGSETHRGIYGTLNNWSRANYYVVTLLTDPIPLNGSSESAKGSEWRWGTFFLKFRYHALPNFFFYPILFPLTPFPMSREKNRSAMRAATMSRFGTESRLLKQVQLTASIGGSVPLFN